VYAYLSRRVGRQGADDLFNEVWTRAYAARATYDNRLGQELPWLYGIARNVLRAHWRTLQRPEIAPEPAVLDLFADADDRLDAARQLEQLRAAVLRLSDDEREVLSSSPGSV
jgi:RNA polymerase sigma-70 factor (ECF subfamily)